jgi:hypothetical protein
MRDKPVSEIIQPNTEDFDGEYWDPWDALCNRCASYSGQVDQDAINVLKGIRDKLYCSDIAALYGMSESHVELLQCIFCSANWCEYGTSPRGCFPIDREGFPALIAAWEDFYRRHWKQEPASADTHPKDGDGEAAPLVSGAVPKGDAQCQ